MILLASFLTAFVIALSFALMLKHKSKQFRKMPPGPVGVPLLGYLPFLDVNHLGKSFKKIGEKFGDVFSLKVGTELAVVLNSYEAIKKAFAMDELTSRPNTFMFRFFSQGEHGIASASGETWRVQSKFAQTQLKKLGLGKAKMESFLQDEVQDLITELEDKSANGAKPVEIGFEINVAVVNVLWAMITGERRPHNDPKLLNFLKAVNRGIELATTSGVLLFMPFLIKVLPEWIFGITEMRKWMGQTYGYLKDVIGNHKINQSGAHEEPKDFIDAFLKEQNKSDCHSSFTDFQLEVLCSELFGAGGEPTSVTLKWAIRYLAKNPEIQARAQEELAKIVGSDRPVHLSDRQDLPYMQALIMDIIRISDIHPIGVMHSPSQDTIIDGYHIPKGTFVFPNFHRVHRDPQYWEKPDQLYPEHWLNSEGEFVPKHEGFLSFGTGKRKCPGHDVALVELFAFLSNLLQKFTFKLTPGDCGKIESTAGCVVSPKPYLIILEPRI
jgi:cytochrome P450 family 2 subfamily K